MRGVGWVFWHYHSWACLSRYCLFYTIPLLPCSLSTHYRSQHGMFALGEADKCLLQGLSCHLPTNPSRLQKSLGVHTVNAALLDSEHDLGCKRMCRVLLHLKHHQVTCMRHLALQEGRSQMWRLNHTSGRSGMCLSPSSLSWLVSHHSSTSRYQKQMFCFVFNSRHFFSL